MKNLKTLSILAIFGLFASTNTFAQKTADVTVSATVVTALTVANAGNISLGTIQADATSTLKAGASDAVTSNSNVGVTTTYGQVTIAGAASTGVQVDFTGATLTDGAGANPTAFTTLAYSAEKNGGAGLFTTGATIDLDGSGDATLDFGGTLAAVAGANAGSYATTNAGGSPITVTVTYN